MKLELDETDLAEQWKDLMPDSVRFEHFNKTAQIAIRTMGGATFVYQENLNVMKQHIEIKVPSITNIDLDALETKVIAAAACGEQHVWRKGDSAEQVAQRAAGESISVGKFNFGKAKIQASMRHEKRAAEIFGCDVKDVTEEQREWARNVAFGETYGKTGRKPCDICCGHGCNICKETGFDVGTLTSEDFGHHPSGRDE